MRIALIGNQNSGKSTLFNVLTGSNQKIGNWPGVTIEQKSGIMRGTDYEIIDLPGVYSLSPYNVEEQISRNFFLANNLDLIINVVDATQIERSFYLTTQILELKIPTIIVLNMSDLLDQRNIKIDYESLEKALDTTIISISATKKTNIFNLIQTIKNKDYLSNNYNNFYDHVMESKIKEIEQLIDHKYKRFIAVKLIEGDITFGSFLTEEIREIIHDLKTGYNRDLEQIIADERYRHIEIIRDDAIDAKKQKKTFSDKIDDIILNRYLAIPIFFLIMFLIYYLAAGPVGGGLVEIVEDLVSDFSVFFYNLLKNLGASDWSASLVTDGILSGVGAIISFLPQLIILFILISLLETTGYMARIAFVFDRVFRRLGLSGNALIPFIVGSGCSVPAILSTRTINDQTEKKMTVILTPFIPCSAKLPIITLFAGHFFKNNAGLVSASLYFLAIIVIMLSALVLKRFMNKNNTSPFLLELPSYKVPQFKYIAKDVYQKVKEFVSHAGTVILLAAVVIWFLISFNFKMQYGIDIDESILAFFGKILSYIFYPMLGTLSWATSVSAVQGLIAKEQVVASMAIIAGYSETTQQGLLIFRSEIFSFFTGASAYAFMVFNLFSAPCFGAIGAMKKELGSTKLMLKAVFFQTFVAWALAVLVFQLFNLFGGIL